MAKFEEVISINIQTSVDGSFLTRKEEIPPERKMCEGISIKGKSFSQYIMRRMEKDCIGYSPSEDFMEGYAHLNTIRAIIPKEPYEFLVYVHELGHIKSKQYHRTPSFYGVHSKACPATVENELNAWLWGLRYYKRLGFKLCAKGVVAIQKSFGSYLKNADEDVARMASDRLYEAHGVHVEWRKPKNHFTDNLSVTLGMI